MQKKKDQDRNFLVYTTDGSFSTGSEDKKRDRGESTDHRIRITLDRKQRKGKAVTLISGYAESHESLEALCRGLKKMCGVGGSVKEGQILLQGDHRKKVLDFFLKKGFRDTKLSG